MESGMKLNRTKVRMSASDKRRGVKIPVRLNQELAEFIGIVVGDGHLSFYPGRGKKGTRFVRRSMQIAANGAEKEYIAYIIEQFYRLFHFNLIIKKDRRSNSVILEANSKGVFEFLHEVCAIPVNRKTGNLKVPVLIKKGTPELKRAFLRGLADTDFSLSFRNRPGKGYIYPRIKGTFKSKGLVNDLEVLFINLGFRYLLS